MSAQKSAIDVVLGTGSFGIPNAPQDADPAAVKKILADIKTDETKGSSVSTLGDLDAIQRILDEFKAHGHRILDTARIYGGYTSELLLGELEYAGQGLVLDTKIDPTHGFSEEKLSKSLNESLAALKTNKVRVLYLHAPNRSIPLEETLASVTAAYKKGHFEEFGLSNFPAEEVEKAVQLAKEKGYVKPTVYQGMYNLVARGTEDKLFPVLRKHGIRFYAYSPLAGSFLTEQISKDGDTSGSRFDPNTIYGGMYRAHFWKESHFVALDKLKAAAKQHGITVPEIAFRWLQHHSQLKREFGDAFIIGGKSFDRIKQALDFSDKPALPADLVKVANEIWDLVKGDPATYHF